MTTGIVNDTIVEELLIAKHYFHYEGIKYVEFQTVDDADRKFWIRMDEIEKELRRHDDNAFVIIGEIDRLIPMKTILGAEQHYETVLKNCEIASTKNMLTYELLEDREEYPDHYLPCEDKPNDFFKQDYQIGRMVTTYFQFDMEKGIFEKSFVLKEKMKGQKEDHFFILDEDEKYVRLLKAEKDPYIYLIEKDKMPLFFEPENVNMIDEVEKITFKSIGLNSSIRIGAESYDTHFSHVYFYDSLQNKTEATQNTYYQHGILADFDRQLFKKGKKKNEIEFELYFFGKELDMNQFNHILFWDNNKYIGYTKNEDKFIFDDKKTHFEERNGFTRKKYLGDETNPHHIENVQYKKLS